MTRSARVGCVVVRGGFVRVDGRVPHVTAPPPPRKRPHIIFSYRILVRRYDGVIEKRCDKVQRRVLGRIHEYELAWGEFEWFEW